VGSNRSLWAMGSVTMSVWDMETSGLTVSDGGVGLTTAEMMDPYMLGLNGFANDPNWVLDVGRDYPRLAWEGTAGQIIPEPVIDWLSGQGTEKEPYHIDMADQLILLTRARGLWDKHFTLGADIDLDPNLQGRQVFSQAVIQLFSGVFDGNGHVILHLTIVGDSYLGLFGQLGPGAIISNLALEAVNVNGTGDYVGGLVGYNRGSITSSYSNGTVSGHEEVGGLVGYNRGSITSCYSTGSVTGSKNIGGLVGHNYQGSITSCYSTGTVSGHEEVGGLVGSNSGSITSSYSTGPVAGNERVGGLVGCNYEDRGSITSSFWDVETSGLTTSDGGTGKTTAEMQTASTFLDAGWDFVDETENGTEDIWWILEGWDYPRLWWDEEVPFPWEGEGTEDSPFLIYTAEELNMIGSLRLSWNRHFKLMADIDLSGFDGKEGRPTFNIIAPDVFPSTSEFQGYPFSGVFDGSSHMISNFKYNEVNVDYVGLFGCVRGSNAQIINVAVINPEVDAGTRVYVGSLVGHLSQGVITNCFVEGGSVAGNWTVGGLVGRSNGVLAESWASAEVSGGDHVGGLAGATEGRVSNCYAKGNAIGRWSVGGLVGFNYSAEILNCYATGTSQGEQLVGGLIGRNHKGWISACFWDRNASGLMNMCGTEGDEATGCDDNYGKTTAEMQMASTFLEAGWDFVDEAGNGTEDIWWIAESHDYPRLWWELIPEN